MKVQSRCENILVIETYCQYEPKILVEPKQDLFPAHRIVRAPGEHKEALSEQFTHKSGNFTALHGKTVRVVATGSIVEGFAALLAYDPASDAEANVDSMTESAARVVPAEVTRAVRDSVTDAGEVHEGDFIGISRDGVVAIADNPVVCTRLLLSRLLDGTHELVTLIEGEGARVADTRRIEEWLSEEYPDVALEVHQGGQPLYPYLLGIE